MKTTHNFNYLGILLFAACAVATASRNCDAATQNVSVGDNFFSPSSVTINANDSVKWNWTGSRSHTSTSTSGLWDSGTLSPGATYTRIFATAGSFPYKCTIHSGQTGTVTVKRPGPVLSILFPTAGQRVTNVTGSITVKGKASDNVQMTAVQYRLNSGDWATATTTNGWTNWTADITPLPRTNVLRAYAVDLSNRFSLTNSVSFIYVITRPITLVTNGIGKITRNFSGNNLEVGKSYTVTAVPGTGQVFSNWSGSITSTNASLTFVMQSNLTLIANIIPNPFLAAKGTYKGLVAGVEPLQKLSGYLSLTLASTGSYTASIKRGTNTYGFSGRFDVSGNAAKTVKVGTNNWLFSMALDFADTNERLSGTVIDGQGAADLLAYKAVFNSVTNPANQFAGKYNWIIPGNDNAAISPGGDGYATLIVSKGGTAVVAGSLADSSATLSQTVTLSRNGAAAVYVPLYGGVGSALSWLYFDTSSSPSASFEGDVSWIKPAKSVNKYYPLGFTNVFRTSGLRYTPPTTNRVIALTNGAVLFQGGNLSGLITNEIQLTASNKIIDDTLSNKLSLTITLTNGVFSGKFRVPGTTRTNTFKGALLQDFNSGYGYFLGTNQSGRVFIGPEE